MKGNVIKEFYYTGDYYGFTRKEVVISTLDTGEEVTDFEYTYFYSRKVKMNLAIDYNGDLEIITNEKLQMDGVLQNIVDSAGEQVYENGVWTIFKTAPVLGPLGLREGYKYKAELTSGNL